MGRALVIRKMEHYCAYQDRCLSEARKKLTSLGWIGQEAEGILNELKECGFIDEARFARSYAGGKFRMNHWGRNRIRYRLKQKGIPSSLIREGLEEIPEEDYRRLILDLASRKHASPGRSGNQGLYLGVRTYLLGRGFEAELIQELLGQDSGTRGSGRKI